MTPARSDISNAWKRLIRPMVVEQIRAQALGYLMCCPVQVPSLLKILYPTTESKHKIFSIPDSLHIEMIKNARCGFYKKACPFSG